MKYFKVFFLGIIFLASPIFSENSKDNLEKVIEFGVKEPLKNLYPKNKINAKERKFLFSLRNERKNFENNNVFKNLEDYIGSISGYVFNEEGLPLEGIEVSLIPSGIDSHSNDFNAIRLKNYSSKTNSFGFYVINFEFEGNYVLMAYDPLNFYFTQFYDHKESFISADLLYLKAGDNLTDLNFNLKKAATISGKIKDSKTGEGIWGVYVYTINNNASFIDYTNYFITSLTDDFGNYLLAGLSPGEYEIYFYDPSKFYGEDGILGKIKIIDSEDLGGIDFSLEPKDTGIMGKVTMPNGEPAKNAWVYASTYIEFEDFYTFTNTKGEYKLGANPGNYLVSSNSFEVTTLPTYYPGVRDARDATKVEVEKEEITKDINFSLLPAAIISGTVLSSSHEPLEQIFIEVFDKDGFLISWSTSNSDGFYKIGNLDEGIYYLYAWDFEGNYAPQWYYGKNTFEEATPIFAKAGEEKKEINFTLNLAGKIKGKVIDSLSGTPIRDVFLAAFSNNYYFETYGFSDEEGNFELKGFLTGSYILFGYDFRGEYVSTYYDGVFNLEEATPIFVEEGKEEYVTFKMIKGGTIKGFVKNTSNEVINTAFLEVYDLKGNWAGLGYTLEDGSYQIGGLREGKYILYAYDGLGEYAPKWYPNADNSKDAMEIEIYLGEIEDGINFYLPKGGSISGKVTDNQQNPLPYFTLFAEKIDDSLNWASNLHWGFTDEEGNYKIKGLGSGNYRVGLILPNGWILYYPDTLIIEEAVPVPVLEAQETKDINFQVNLGLGGISGYVKEENTNNPIPHTYVIVFDLWGIPLSFGLTNEYGNYYAPFKSRQI